MAMNDKTLSNVVKIEVRFWNVEMYEKFAILFKDIRKVYFLSLINRMQSLRTNALSLSCKTQT